MSIKLCILKSISRLLTWWVVLSVKAELDNLSGNKGRHSGKVQDSEVLLEEGGREHGEGEVDDVPVLIRGSLRRSDCSHNEKEVSGHFGIPAMISQVGSGIPIRPNWLYSTICIVALEMVGSKMFFFYTDQGVNLSRLNQSLVISSSANRRAFQTFQKYSFGFGFQWPKAVSKSEYRYSFSSTITFRAFSGSVRLANRS